MQKEICFKIDGHELFLDFMLEEYEFGPVFYICRDGQNRKYAVWCIDFDKEAYAIVRVPLILLNDMLHGLIPIRDFFLSRNTFWKVRCMDDSCENDQVEKLGVEDFPVETLPNEDFVYKSFDTPHRDYVERIEKELQDQYNNIPVSPVTYRLVRLLMKNISKEIKLFAVTILVAIPLLTAPVSAASLFPDEAGFQVINGTYYAPADEYGPFLQEAMSKSTPAVPYTRLSSYYKNINGKQAMTPQNFQMIMSEEKACEDWIAANIQSIVPQGTPAINAYVIVADWIADHCYYDLSIQNSAEEGRLAQSAYMAFTQGRGICATYTTAFNSLMSALPIANGIVDYTAANPAHIQTKFINNGIHAWSAWSLDGTSWFQTDVTYYDYFGKKQKAYLVMPPAILKDEYHAGGSSKYFAK